MFYDFNVLERQKWNYRFTLRAVVRSGNIVSVVFGAMIYHFKYHLS